MRQLKAILADNFVDFKGIIEKGELIRKVLQVREARVKSRRDREKLFKKDKHDGDEQEAAQCDGGGGVGDEATDSGGDNKLCSICWEREKNCVILECGHMCSCVECTKPLKECPICRQNITRAVRVFIS